MLLVKIKSRVNTKPQIAKDQEFRFFINDLKVKNHVITYNSDNFFWVSLENFDAVKNRAIA